MCSPFEGFKLRSRPSRPGRKRSRNVWVALWVPRWCPWVSDVQGAVWRPTAKSSGSRGHLVELSFCLGSPPSRTGRNSRWRSRGRGTDPIGGHSFDFFQETGPADLVERVLAAVERRGVGRVVSEPQLDGGGGGSVISCVTVPSTDLAVSRRTVFPTDGPWQPSFQRHL